MTTISPYVLEPGSAPSGNPVVHLPVRVRPFAHLDSPEAHTAVDEGQLVAVHANEHNQRTECSRFDKYDHTIGTHGMWVPNMGAIPEYLVGSNTHGQFKKYGWCRGDGAYYTAPRVRRHDWEDKQDSKTWRLTCYQQAQGWSGPPYQVGARLVGGFSIVLLVEPQGYVCVDRNLSEGEFMATRLKVLSVLGTRDYRMARGWSGDTYYWEANGWVDNPDTINWING